MCHPFDIRCYVYKADDSMVYNSCQEGIFVKLLARIIFYRFRASMQYDKLWSYLVAHNRNKDSVVSGRNSILYNVAML
jgi:hypothetical protein